MGTEPAAELEALNDCRRRYVDNMAALYRRDPRLALEIERVPFSELPLLERTRDGRLTVKVAADDGRDVYVHSKYRPVAEARTLIDDLNTDENPTFFIAGFGLGYHLVELERVMESPLLIVAEDDLALVKSGLCCVDLAEPIRDGRLLLLNSAERVAVHERLKGADTDIMLGSQFVTLPHTLRCHARFHADMRVQLADFVSFMKLQIVTVLRNARITCKNIAYNLPSYLSHAGVEVLRGRAAGFPAVIVSAGPSLARNLEQLDALRERVVVIAVQTVLKTLLERGCRPHFVTSLDFHEVSTQFFRGIDDLTGVTLVAEPKATWHVLDRYAGQMHVLHNTFVDELLREAAPARGALKAGTTVAHLAFYLAEYLGCDPIILVGQDLAYSEGLYYPPGMPIEHIWRPEMGRFCTAESKQWERICRGRPILRTVTDIHGRPTYTDDQLFNYAQQFERDFADSPATIIHACEGGMKLDGTRIMTLREASKEFCTRPLPRELFVPQKSEPSVDLKERAVAE
ncbi:MAG: motility associated factor glycosyltransferase family protein, partial [Planctomycetes bacterium]|nr:motility associated factor glycosyltransferase family protein [Planctomycetota bacterium]